MLTILGFIFGSLICLLLMVSLIPIVLSASVDFGDGQQRLKASVSWAGIVRVSVEYIDRTFKAVLKILWYLRDLKESAEEEFHEKPAASEPSKSKPTFTARSTEATQAPLSTDPIRKIESTPVESSISSSHQTEKIKHQPQPADSTKRKSEPDKGTDEFFTKDLMWYFVKDSKLRTTLLRWLRKSAILSLRLVSFDLVSINLHAGLDDPNETGRMYGYALGVQNALSLGLRKPLAITLKPSFDKPCMDFHGRLRMHTTTAHIVFSFFWMLLIFPYLTAFFTWRRYKKEKSAIKDS